MESRPHHVTVCVCTYRRPALLERLLRHLSRQDTAGHFTVSAVVADNDRDRSAEPVVVAFAQSAAFPVVYCHEPHQSIALARNAAVAHATGDFVAMIDDDEFPTEAWLLTLLTACQTHHADGALGPVKPHFDEEPPAWIRAGGFYDRPTYPTGFVIDWRKGRTGNALVKRTLFGEDPPPFRPEFRTGEDQDFFRRMIERGHVFVWCDEAVAYEVVPPVRWGRRFLIRRALLRGQVSLSHPGMGARAVMKSAVAASLYAISLPFAALLGQARFMQCLVKLCDHAGRLLAAGGIEVVKDQYVTE
jgi:glycosyltransferase involved in cell wall biosynthesis